MKFATGTSKTAYTEPVYKRLLGGLLLSVLFHAALLSLQFGIPGLGLSGSMTLSQDPLYDIAPLTIQINNTPPFAAPVSVEEQVLPLPLLPEVPVKIAQGIRLFAPVIEKTPISEKKASSIKKKKAIQAAPLAPPQPPPIPAADPVRVIAQDQHTDDSFVVPLPDPEEPENKMAEKTGQKQEEVQGEIADPAVQLQKDAENLVELNAEKEKQEFLAKQILAEEKLRKSQALQLEKQQAELILKQQQEAAKKIDDKKRLEAIRLEREAMRETEENARRQALSLALQQQQAQDQAKRALEQEAQREFERKVEGQLRKERQRIADKAELAKIEEDKRQQEQQQAELRQRRIEEELVKQKIAEQKVVEQKAAEQKAAEQRAAEQRAAEQRAAEQGQPSRGQPSRGQPSRGQPSRGQPSRGQPSRGQPSSVAGTRHWRSHRATPRKLQIAPRAAVLGLAMPGPGK